MKKNAPDRKVTIKYDDEEILSLVSVSNTALAVESRRKSLAWHHVHETLSESANEGELDASDVENLIKWLPLADSCPGCQTICWPISYWPAGYGEEAHHEYSCHACMTDWRCWWAESEWNKCTVIFEEKS
jgi:hypothetical protein